MSDYDDKYVTGYTTQKSHHKSYKPGSKSCHIKPESYSCKKKDWHYDNAPGCGGRKRPVCSRVDPHVCPRIDGVEGDAYFDHAPQVACQYPLHAFKTAKGLKTWLKKFGEDGQFNDEIMPYFCSQPSVDCPVHEHSGKKMKSCSRFNDNSAEGKICRKWSKKFPGKTKRIEQKYCQTFKTKDCKMSTYDDHDDSYDDSYDRNSNSDCKRKKRRRKDDECDDDSGFFGGGVFIFFIFILLIIIIIAAAACGRRGRGRGGW